MIAQKALLKRRQFYTLFQRMDCKDLLFICVPEYFAGAPLINMD